MNRNIFKSKLLVISVIFLFIFLLSSDVLSQRNVSVQRDVEKLIKEGKELYNNGEYKEAIIKFLEAKDLARTREELSEVYFNLSAAYYANNQSAEAEEYLRKSLEILPERTINALYHPRGFVELFNQMKAEFIKPVVKEKPVVEKKVKKKGGGALILVIGVLVAGGGAAALLLMGKKENGEGGNGGTTTGSIQVNSTPTGASVYLDGSDTGQTTNCTLTNVSAGSHTVKLVKEGYQDYETSVSVTAGQTSSVDATLTAHTITVTSPTSGSICIKGDEVNIAWETDESSGSAGNMRAGSGLNPLSPGSSVASSYQRRRAIRYRRSFLEVRRVRRGLESMDLWQDKEIGLSKLSRIKGVSKKSSSTSKEEESVPQRGRDIGTKRKDMRFNRTGFPRVYRDSFQRTIPLSKMKILTITNVKIDLYKGGSLVETIVSSTENDGSYTWTVDTTLTDDSNYKVRISCASDSEVYGESANFEIQEPILDAPSNLEATAVSSSQIDLSWTDNSNNESGFKIERKTGASGSWSQIDTVNADVTTYQDTGLEASTTYYYRVRAYNAKGNSSYSNEASASTELAAPSNLEATAVSSSQIDLSWTDNSNNESGFKIERKTGASGSWSQIDTVNADVTSYQETGLTDGTMYYYRVRAYNAAGNSSYSNEASAATEIAAPSNLQATAVSSSQINLSWTDNSSSESGFKIERKTGASGSWSQIDTVNADVTSYQDTGLGGGTTCYYRVRAYNATGNSSYSNEASASTSSGYEFLTKWGSEGSGDGQFRWPKGIAVDSSGYVYVADEYNHRIQKFTSTGTFLTKWGSSGTGDGQFDKPGGIAVDSSDYVYVSDSSNHRIQKFTSDGTFVTKWGSSGGGDGQFNGPLGIAVDSSDYVYVSDSSNHRIQKFTSDGTFVTKWGSGGTGDGQFLNPIGIAVDSSGYVYVADYNNDRIQKFTSDGTFVTKWGSGGTGDGQFDHPRGIAVDSSGYVYVVDYNNHRIQKFTSDGTFVTKWGSGGIGDGQFSFPHGVAVDSSGYVYVTDTNKHRIQKFGPASAAPKTDALKFNLLNSPLIHKLKAQQKLLNKKDSGNKKRK